MGSCNGSTDQCSVTIRDVSGGSGAYSRTEYYGGSNWWEVYRSTARESRGKWRAHRECDAMGGVQHIRKPHIFFHSIFYERDVQVPHDLVLTKEFNSAILNPLIPSFPPPFSLQKQP